MAPSQQGLAGAALVGLHRLQPRTSHWDQPLLVALARHLKVAKLGVQVSGAQRNQFRDAQTGGVEQLEHGSVPRPFGAVGIGGCQQALDIFQSQIAGQDLPGLGRFQVQCGVGFEHTVAQ